VNLNPTDVVPSFLFVGKFLLDYGIGLFFIIATFFSLILSLRFRKQFSKILVFDLIFLTAILSVVSVNTFLGAGLNLKAPYFNAVKYDYQALPFFSLLAASLIAKSFSLYGSTKTMRKLRKYFYIAVIIAGVGLLVGAIITNIFYLHLISLWPSILFRFDESRDDGYFFFHNNPIDSSSPLLILQYFGFMFVLSGLIWISKDELANLINLIIAKIKPSVPSS
jgi:hypothetical protein